LAQNKTAEEEREKWRLIYYWRSLPRLSSSTPPAVVHPLARTYVDEASRKQLGAARMRENYKQSRYRGFNCTIAGSNKIEIVPIVFETFGGMGEEAKKCFEYLYACMQSKR